jgi:hypothetical protein
MANDEQRTGPSNAQLAIAGGAGVLPFLGMIGQSRLKSNDAYTAAKNYQTLSGLSDARRPGDVVLYANKGGNSGAYQIAQELSSGSPYYHAESVGAGNKLYDAGHKGSKDFISRNYDSAVLLRPKDAAGSEVGKHITRKAGPARYDHGKAVSSYLKELFLPKITGKGGRAPEGINCDGQICSTMPADAYETVTKRRVTRGVSGGSTLPADFLRNDSAYEIVGRAGEDIPIRARGALAKRLALRGALGLGLAGTAYAGYNKPEIPATIAGAATLPLLYRALHKGNKMTPVSELLVNAAARRREEGISGMLKYLKNAPGMKRLLALTAGGSLAGYAGVKGLRHALQLNSPQDTPQE